MSQFDSNLATRTTVSAMIDSFNQASNMITEGYKILAEAEQILEAAFGNHYSDFDTVDQNSGRSSPNDFIQKKIKRSAWRSLINMLEIRKALSIKRAKELDENLEDADKLPPIELETVFEMFSTLVNNSESFAREAIAEVYEDLRPRQSRYKTNQKNAHEHIGRKIILSGRIQNRYGGGFQINYYQSSNFIALDKVFHLLDGGKLALDGYQSPLIDAINTCEGGQGETDYFRFKCYGNCNLHLEFKRLDLLKKFNAIAGGANLKSGLL